MLFLSVQKTSEKLGEFGDTVGRAFSTFGQSATQKMGEIK